MNRSIKTAMLVGVAALGLIASVDLMAQAPGTAAQPRVRGGGGQGGGPGGGNFDPAAMQQRMSDMMKERMGVTDDSEWKVIWDRIQKVNQVRMDMGGRGGFGRGRGGQGGGPGGPGGFGGQPNPVVEALQNAIDANNTSDIKAKLAALREYRAKKQVELKAAQDELKKVVNLNQEAQLVMMGYVE
jgi:hypothetical protein